jgi:hypothetical protein
MPVAFLQRNPGQHPNVSTVGDERFFSDFYPSRMVKIIFIVIFAEKYLL